MTLELSYHCFTCQKRGASHGHNIPTYLNHADRELDIQRHSGVEAQVVTMTSLSPQPSPTIDRVPTELLQRIAGLTETNDILNLRSTCKLIEKKTFDVFAETYLAHRECFVLNMVSLRNLEALVSQPFLSSRMRTLTLTLNPYSPDWTKMHVAARGERFEHHHEQQIALDWLYDETYERYRGPVDRALIARILVQLKRAGHCALSVVMTRYYLRAEASGDYYRPPEKTLYHDLYHAATSDAQYNLSSITIDYRLTVDLDHQTQGAVSHLRDVRAIDMDLSPNPYIHKSGEKRFPRSIDNSYIFRSLLLSTTNLVHLHLRGLSREHHPVESLLLSQQPLNQLQNLSLAQGSLRGDTLIKIIKDSGSRLRKLDINLLLLEATSWHGIFDQLRESCSNLQVLELRTLGILQGDRKMYTLLFDDRMRELVVHADWQCNVTHSSRESQPGYERLSKMVVVGQQHVRDTVLALSADPWNYEHEGSDRHTVLR